MTSQKNKGRTDATQKQSIDFNSYSHSVGAVARFARLRYLETIGKFFFQRDDGTLELKSLANANRAIAHIVACESIEQLQQSFMDAQSTDIFVSGVPSSDGLTVVTIAKRGDGEIARCKDDFPFPQGPGVMFLDNDHPVGEGDNQFFTYVKAVPALDAASYVYAPSSSAWIHDEVTGNVLKGAGGQHYAVPVKDASDITRAIVALHDRLVLVGFGVPVVRASGCIDIRSPADTAMKTSNQPLFQRATVGPGLIHCKPDHIGAHRGDVFLFDTRLIPDLTNDELRRKAEIEQELKATVADEAEEARAKWIEKHAYKVARTNDIPIEQAKVILRQALTKDSDNARFDLIPGIQVKFASGWIDVFELLTNPEKYDGKPCADPHEPDYGGGVGVAKFYANTKGKPTINSHAHGGQMFFLHHDPKEIDLSCILPHDLKRAAGNNHQTNTAPDSGRSNPMSYWLKGIVPISQGSKAEFHPLGLKNAIQLKDKPEAVNFVVHDFIQEGVVFFAGQQGIGKTSALLPLAMAQAGLHEHGYQFAPKKPERWRHIIYLTEDAAQVNRIIAAMVNRDLFTLEQAQERIHVIPAVAMSADEFVKVRDEYVSLLADESGVQLLPLVVADTRSACFVVDSENDNAEMSNLVAALKQNFAGLPIWVIAHLSKETATRSNAATLSVRGAGSAEGDAHQVLFLVKEQDNSRWLVRGKTRFESPWQELSMRSELISVLALDRWREVVSMNVRWSVVEVPTDLRSELKARIKADAEKAELAEMRDEIRNAVQEGWNLGHPLNKQGVKAKIKRKTATVISIIDSLLVEGWLVEVSVPSKERTHPKRSAFLVNLSTVQYESFRANGLLPEELKVIPQSWRKSSISSVPDPDIDTSESIAL